MAPSSYQSSLPPPAASSSERAASRPDHDLSLACPFCHIAAVYPPFDPTRPPHPSAPSLSPALTSPSPATYVLLSTPLLVAFLDIQPLSRGHLLLCPRRHAPKLTDAAPAEAAELGRFLRVLSAALSRATGVEDWNVVQNNGAAAAQVVPHMHFHVIPRPEIRAQGRWSEKFTMFGRGTREDLDDEDAEVLAERIRKGVAEVLEEERIGQAEGKAKL
ncbi:HIT domain-containing protein [Pleurostoma richardsiae]|uniref:HIT domain-containing protein n=1 Tax=Pleurostoma richardsiae TaxID=41990 RepID=A0AA38R8D9_9PEZI|nr:HIT domain-containing protein [Pleurostoma richardsiae]